MKLENCRTRKTAVRRNPGAAEIVKVDGGYAIFVNRMEYCIWKNQK